MKNVLLLGMDGAGKTVLLRRMRLMCADEKPKGSALARLLMRRDDKAAATPQSNFHVTTPTTGIEEETLSHSGAMFTVKEVGAPMLSMWQAYYAQCDQYLFVIDVSNAPQLASATMELFNILRNETMAHKPGCIILNKIDSPLSLPTSLLRSLLSLDQLSSLANIEIVRLSALTGENVGTVLQWISGRTQGNLRLSVFDANNSRVHPAAV